MEIDRHYKRKIQIIATQVYINEVKDLSGEKSAGLLQKRISRKPHQGSSAYWSKTSGNFSRYANGTKVIEGPDLINKIESEWPGTKYLRQHPLWFILENPLSDPESIDKQMRLLDGSIKTYVFSKGSETGYYSRKTWRDVQPFYEVGAQNNLDSLACLLMVIREMELSERWHSCAVAKRFAHELFLRLAGVKPLNLAANRLYKIIYKVFMEREISLTKTKRKAKENEKPEVIYPPRSDVIYPIPSFVHSDNLLNSELSEIVSLARKYLPSLEMDDQRSELSFLFWAYTFGLERTRKAIQPDPYTLKNKKFTDTLVSAHKLNLPSVYAPHHSLID